MKKIVINKELRIRFKIYILILINILIGQELFARDEFLYLGPLTVRNFKGSIVLEQSFRNRLYSSYFDEQLTIDTASASLFRGNINLNTSAFLFSPKLIDFSINADYSPSINTGNVVVMPEFSEALTSNRLSGQATILNTLPINLNIFGETGNGITKSDFGIQRKNVYTSYGANFMFDNSIMPLSLGYLKNTNNEKDIISGYDFNNFTERIDGNVIANLDGFMSNSLNASYQTVQTQYFTTANNKNNILEVNLTNSLKDNIDFIHLNNSLIYNKSIGDYNYKRWNEFASLYMNLPLKFKITSFYNYQVNTMDSSKNTLASPRIILEHQLYSSLHSRAFFEQQNLKQYYKDVNNYGNTRNIYGYSFNYTKRIPTGSFGLGYEFRKNKEDQNNTSSSLYILNEAYTLDDAVQTLLKYPKVIESSIVVKDITGTLRYQKDVDYLLVMVNGYYQIIRIPSGRIANQSTVYIDYIPELAKVSKYDLNMNAFNANLSLFDGKLGLFYRNYSNSFNNVDVSDINSLKVIHQNTVGMNFNLWKMSASLVYDVMNSNISPYKSYNFNLSYADVLLTRMTTNLSASISKTDNYDTDFTAVNASLNGSITYPFNNKLYLNVIGFYRYTKYSTSIDLKYLNMNAELKYVLYNTYLSFGLNIYNQKYQQSDIKYTGLFIRLERAFGY